MTDFKNIQKINSIIQVQSEKEMKKEVKLKRVEPLNVDCVRV